MLLIVISSIVHHFKERQAIRDTWASKSFNRNLRYVVRTVFLLGRAIYDSAGQERMASESKIHDDIIQEDFVDSYFNLLVCI